MTSKFLKKVLLLALVISTVYGVGRLYYRITDGFLEENIQFDLPYDSRWESPALSVEKKNEIDAILAQEFYYLGKGCQSYVFRSQDDKYVIKFFKYQRFKPQSWLSAFTFIPAVDNYQLQKKDLKKQKLDYLFSSWKLSYDELQPETGVLYVNLNKNSNLWDKLIVYDKMGLKHELQLDSLEFMLQKKANMLCPELLRLKSNNDLAACEELVDNLLAMLLSEYQRGFADNDHALMQNTGVFDQKPIHIDVGQFVRNSIASDPRVYSQELFNKMWKFRIWLAQEYPELAQYTQESLKMAIGPSFDKLTPQLNKASMGRIPYGGVSLGKPVMCPR
ncbi:MAG: hypothetical protein H0W50_10735 [Parachlamydiaceae bacterium]|nr:hypothetical protein [Parachlamydiaceae bacterium]